MISHEPVASSYKVLTIIGTCFDGIGSVWLARHSGTGNLVALKKYDLDKCDYEVLSLLHHEVCTMQTLRHPNLMPCLSSFVLGCELWLIEPICGYGSAKDLLAAHFNQGLPEQAIALILRDVLKALNYLHRQGIIHRGIRASHVLIAESGSTYVTGLRSSLQLYRRGRRLHAAHRYPLSCRDALNWLSPELLAQDLRGYTESSDIYSLGVLACELANGIEPFAQMPATAMLHEKLSGAGEPVLLDARTIDPALAAREIGESAGRTGSVSDAGSDALALSYQRVMRVAPRRRFSDHFHQFVRVCVEREPRRRPAAAQLLAHPFITRLCKRAPPLTHLLRPGVPVNESNLLEGEQIKSDSLVMDMFHMQLNSPHNPWEF